LDDGPSDFTTTTLATAADEPRIAAVAAPTSQSFPSIFKLLGLLAPIEIAARRWAQRRVGIFRVALAVSYALI
jgi:hypothetical protein